MDQFGVRARRGGDHHAVQAVRVHPGEGFGCLGTESVREHACAGRVGIGDDDAVHTGKGLQGLGVERSDASGADQADLHVPAPVVWVDGGRLRDRFFAALGGWGSGRERLEPWRLGRMRAPRLRRSVHVMTY